MSKSFRTSTIIVLLSFRVRTCIYFQFENDEETLKINSQKTKSISFYGRRLRYKTIKNIYWKNNGVSPRYTRILQRFTTVT